MVKHGSSWLTIKYRGDDNGQVAYDNGRQCSTMVKLCKVNLEE